MIVDNELVVAGEAFEDDEDDISEIILQNLGK
jgi:hypothetical protein